MADDDDQPHSAAPGSTAAILLDLVARDGRSPRAISRASGLSADAVRNAVRVAGSVPRRKTLLALARTLGVPVGVLLGTEPIPEGSSDPPADVTAPRRKGGGDMHRVLKVAVRDAVMRAVADGMEADLAVFEAVHATMLAAVAAGLDDIEVMEIVGGMGLAK